MPSKPKRVATKQANGISSRRRASEKLMPVLNVAVAMARPTPPRRTAVASVTMHRRALIAGQRPSPRCPGCGGRPTQGKQALQRLTVVMKDAVGRSCRGVRSLGAARRHTVQELDGWRAMPAWLYQPGHPLKAEAHKVLNSWADDPKQVRRQVRPVLQVPARPRPDRQNPAHAALAGHHPQFNGGGTSLHLREQQFPSVFSGTMH